MKHMNRINIRTINLLRECANILADSDLMIIQKRPLNYLADIAEKGEQHLAHVEALYRIISIDVYKDEEIAHINEMMRNPLRNLLVEKREDLRGLEIKCKNIHDIENKRKFIESRLSLLLKALGAR